MTERPILFSGEMVRAILAGDKTQTRRAVKPQPVFFGDEENSARGHTELALDGKCPYGAPGDRLWVREMFWRNTTFGGERIKYRADDSVRHIDEKDLPVIDGKDVGIVDGHCWAPSIFMPRWACRIVLEIVAVKVERLAELTDEDAYAEGIHRCSAVPRTEFGFLWEKINGKASLNANPWVWVIAFKRV